MDYRINDLALPVVYYSEDSPYSVSKPYRLTSREITALHYHNTAELGICLSGEGETYIEDKIYSFKEGCFQILPPRVPHLSKASEGCESVWVWISLDPVEIFRTVGLTSPEGVLSLTSPELFLKGVFDKDELPELRQAIEEVISAKTLVDEYGSLSLALSASRFLIAMARLGGIERGASSTQSVYSKIAPALDLIGENLDDSEKLCEGNLADRCSVSASTLRRLFKQHTGCSPKEFIIRSRMAYAEHLLRKTKLTVLDISLRCGYGELSGFNRTFKKYFGIPPLAYRNKNRK